MDERIAKIKARIREIKDYPREGILFKDITPVVRDNECLRFSLDLLSEPFQDRGITTVLGMESRGFIFGVAVAERLGAGFVPIRKPGKLPAETIYEEYELEYGKDRLEMHRDALSPNDRVLIVDDLLATGGTANATLKLARSTGAEIIGASFLIELEFLKGRDKLGNIDVISIIRYDN
jgi:adenine phosphoribosyltransferase